LRFSGEVGCRGDGVAGVNHAVDGTDTQCRVMVYALSGLRQQLRLTQANNLP